MSWKYLIAASLAALSLGACESNPSKEDVGMVSGAVLGGVIGHQIGGGNGNTIATIGGAALGGFVGSRIGRSMDREDQRQASEGADGPCRDFETTTEIDGRKETVHGTACRQPDGSWKTG